MMDLTKGIPEPYLRAAAALGIVLLCVGVKFGTEVLFMVGVGLFAFFVGGLILGLATLVLLWICIGQRRLDALMERFNSIVYVAVYLILCAASCLYCYTHL